MHSQCTARRFHSLVFWRDLSQETRLGPQSCTQTPQPHTKHTPVRMSVYNYHFRPEPVPGYNWLWDTPETNISGQGLLIENNLLILPVLSLKCPSPPLPTGCGFGAQDLCTSVLQCYVLVLKQVPLFFRMSPSVSVLQVPQHHSSSGSSFSLAVSPMFSLGFFWLVTCCKSPSCTKC